MIIEQLSLRDFRNYSVQEIQLHPRVTYLIGNNAQGKTNLIEAIYYVGRGASFRAVQRHDLIRHGQEAGYLHARVQWDGLHDELAVEIGQERRRWLRNGKAVRGPDLEWPHVILFAPEETLLFKGGPDARRAYLDTLIEGVDPAFRGIRRNFTRALQQRNRVLRESPQYSKGQVLAQLAPWTEQLIAWGAQVIALRRQWSERLSHILPVVHREFARVDGDIILQYEPYVTDAESFQARLTERQEEELLRRLTLVGPQRDEIRAQLGGQDLRHFGSQGQHRSVVLSLKLAEIALAREYRGRPPILLLDDVASELDPDRGRAFFSYLETMACQIVLTTTHAEARVPRQQERTSVQIMVASGCLTPQFGFTFS